jgi:hypothetical protein
MNRMPIKINKIIVAGILFLFIGTCVTQNISGYSKESHNSSINVKPSVITLNDDFINAYWKFDECNGNIVGDSSGHNYDGIRYGATWTTDSISGCALEFDGINDYIELSSHSEQIGINKTDDFNISFFFNSSSSSSGIIFSLTGYKNIPEFKIELLENGSLLFKVWTALCGISLNASEDLNDGLWHYVVILFNGITTDPTVEIYIDGTLEATITDWLCEIENVDFLDATIGKRASEDTGFFNGKIDEFKFIKYEGGNGQVPPIINGPVHGHPGYEYEFTFVVYDPEGDEVWIKVDWGDGEITDWLGPYESGEIVTLTHVYDEEGSYYIKAKSKDFWHESHWSEGFEIKIGNQAPEPPVITGDRLYGDPDQELTFRFKSYDYEGHQIYYIINWDDGTTTETEYGPSNTSIKISHIWDEKNDYNITARAVDIKGKESDLSDPLWIRIGDEPPRKPDIDGPIRGSTGEEITFVFTAVDPENDKVSYNIKWGDGEEIKETVWYSSGISIQIPHIWNNTGTYLIEARAKDQFGYNSTWENYEIQIPRNRQSYIDLVKLLYNRFPLIERLLILLKFI